MVSDSTFHLQEYELRINRTLASLEKQGFSQRFWARDVSLWRQGPNGDSVIRERLGWLDVFTKMRDQLPEITGFVDDVRQSGYQCAILMGMGGSSLSPEVSQLTFGTSEGFLELIVLDSTVPSAVLDVERRIDGRKTLFIVSTKSGGTVETISAYQYFSQASHLKQQPTANDFVAITDPGTSLHQLAQEQGFKKVFLNPPDIGGRYSALSLFGLVPAGLIGVDLQALLDRASQMAMRCGPDVQVTSNSAILLGVVMAELALLGRDKMTMVFSPEIGAFGSWVEQLVAESTGKNGRGILPVDSEPIMDADRYGDDRWLVYTRLASSANTDLDTEILRLVDAGIPVVQIDITDKYDIGAEYLRWEIATAVASALLGVNAFDQPNVQESKDNTDNLLKSFLKSGTLPHETPVLLGEGIQIYCDSKMKSELDSIRMTSKIAEDNVVANLKAFLSMHQPSNYIAIMAFLHRTATTDKLLQTIRQSIVNSLGASVTIGYGPRFLHSTGQIHKGGPNSGLFIQFTSDDLEQVEIPGQAYSFSVLKQAQAIGDATALRRTGRPLIRIHLQSDFEAALKKVAGWFEAATS